MHGPLGVGPIDFFTQFLQYTALSTQPATHVAVMREATAIIMAAKVEQYIAETCKMQHSFTCIFTSKVCCANRTFRSVSTIYCSFHSASHSYGSDEGSLQPSLWLPKLSSILQKLAKYSTALHGPLGVGPIDFFTQFLQYTALSTQPATHVAVIREAYSHHYGCQS